MLEGEEGWGEADLHKYFPFHEPEAETNSFLGKGMIFGICPSAFEAVCHGDLIIFRIVFN